MSSQEERPTLGDRKRRLPQPAADESVDPIDYRRPETLTSAPAPLEPASTAQPIPVSAPIPAPRGRPRREVTVPFATRLSPEIAELIDQAVANGEGGGVIRNVVEEAIRARWGRG
ncbi:hypothetical protein IWX81_002861 [Salinibacterium sp. CAN_S4]